MFRAGVGGYVGTFTGRFYTEYSEEISDYSSATSEYPSRVMKAKKKLTASENVQQKTIQKTDHL